MTYLYAPVATSQIFTVLSQEAVANFLSSKEMSQSAIMLTCPLNAIKDVCYVNLLMFPVIKKPYMLLILILNTGRALITGSTYIY